jgi:hypothetical protein
VSAPQREPGKGLSRTKIMALTLLAEMLGSVLIVVLLPFAWSVRIVLLAVYVGAAHYVSLACLRRRDP